ncbi:MAG: hypothetical protein RL418_289 [Actinomycetota bacterium]
MGNKVSKRLLTGIATIGLVASTSLTMVAPAHAENDTVAFSPMSFQIPALAGMYEGFKGYGASKGLTVIQAPDANFDPTKQKQDLESLITNGTIKGWWSLAAGDPSVLKSTLLKAQEKGIVAVVNGVPADYGFTGMQAGITFARINYEYEGWVMGVEMARCMYRLKQTSGTIIMGANPAGTPGKAQMEKRFLDALKQYAPKVKVARTLLLDGDRATQQKMIATSLQASPKSIGIVAFTDEGSLGAVSAVKARGKKASNYCIIGAGGGEEALAAVKADNIHAVAKLDFQKDLMQTVDTLAAMIKNPTAKGKQLSVPVSIVK